MPSSGPHRSYLRFFIGRKTGITNWKFKPSSVVHFLFLPLFDSDRELWVFTANKTLNWYLINISQLLTTINISGLYNSAVHFLLPRTPLFLWERDRENEESHTIIISDAEFLYCLSSRKGIMSVITVTWFLQGFIFTRLIIYSFSSLSRKTES